MYYQAPMLHASNKVLEKKKKDEHDESQLGKTEDLRGMDQLA